MPEPELARVPCGPPIEIKAKPDDVIVLDDASGEVIDVVTTPANGHVSLDAPDCSNSITLVATYYSYGARDALTITDVAPGARIDFMVDRWGEQATQEARTPISVNFTAVDDTSYANFFAPSCSFEVAGVGSCAHPPKMIYASAASYGVGDPIAYALVPAVMDTAHYERMTATVDSWRTDFAVMGFDIASLPHGSMAGISVYMHAQGETYAVSTPNAIPPVGDAYTVITGAYRDQTDAARYRRDLIIDPFSSPPSHYTADFSSIAAVESASLSDIKTFAWETRSSYADVTRICAQWGDGPLSEWCVLAPSDLRAITFPCLPSAINPTEPPSLYGVSTIDTSLAMDYEDILRRPFQSFAAPWSGGPGLRIRVSTLGFVPPPWWWL